MFNSLYTGFSLFLSVCLFFNVFVCNFADKQLNKCFMNVSGWVGHAQRTVWTMTKGTICNNVCVDGWGWRVGVGAWVGGGGGWWGWRVEVLDCFTTGSHFYAPQTSCGRGLHSQRASCLFKWPLLNEVRSVISMICHVISYIWNSD